MCRAMEEMRAEAEARGRTEGEARASAAIAENLRRAGFSEEMIQQAIQYNKDDES